ncbi:winged helix-turn-helix domain-containing protein [Salinarchaeum chitinilyticum]
MDASDDAGDPNEEPDGLDERYVAAFDVVRSPARVDILLALAEQASVDPDAPALSFSALHDRVDIDDSGQFNYHLDKLRDHLVHSTEDGYRLSPRGHEVAGAILSGAFAAGEDLPAEPLAGACPYCDADIQAAYEQGQIVVECANDHTLFTSSVPDDLATEASLADVLEEVRARARYKLQIVLEGTCTYCYGDVEWSVTHRDDHPEPVLYEGRCTRCGVGYSAPPNYAVLFHPAVVAFFWEHGVDVRSIVAWEIADWTVDQTLRSEDPVRIEVVFGTDDARLAVTIDDAAAVVDVEQTPLEEAGTSESEAGS